MLTGILKRGFHNKLPLFQSVQFKEVQSLVQSNISKAEKEQELIIDVREKDEYSNGHIPSARSLPLSSTFFSDIEGVDSETFQKIFGFKKPSKDQKFVVYCLSGRRSQIATDAFKKAGYNGVDNYTGSWSDWQVNTKK